MTTSPSSACRSVALCLMSFLSLAFVDNSHAQSPDKDQDRCRSVSAGTCAVAKKLGRGINMGNMLDAPREGDWGVRLDPAYVDKVAGVFNTVRVPVRWSNHAALTADATIDEFFFGRIDNVVDSLLATGAYVILNMHHYNQLFGDRLHPHESEVSPDVVDDRYLAMWRQISLRYKDRSSRLIFEPLNEPHGKIDSDRWNVLLPKTLEVIRKSNQNRIVMIGPTSWNAVTDLQKLVVPIDRNLIVTVHNYDPFLFTHQGLTYLPMNMPTGVTCCDAGQQRSIQTALDVALKWSKERGYPIYLGEFGANHLADQASREFYARYVRDEAEKRGFSWAYWEFAASFGLFNPKTYAWIEPIRRALLD